MRRPSSKFSHSTLPLLDNLIHTRSTFVCTMAGNPAWMGVGVGRVGWVVHYDVQSTNKSPEYSNGIAHPPMRPCHAQARAGGRPFSFLALTGNGKCISPLQRISILSDFPVRHSSFNEKRNGSSRECKEKGFLEGRTLYRGRHAPSDRIDVDVRVPSRRGTRNGGTEGRRDGGTEASRRSLHSFLG